MLIYLARHEMWEERGLGEKEPRSGPRTPDQEKRVYGVENLEDGSIGRPVAYHRCIYQLGQSHLCAAKVGVGLIQFTIQNTMANPSMPTNIRMKDRRHEARLYIYGRNEG